MKSFFRLVLLALVLVVVALISALTAMRLAIHGHEVTVPNLVGESPAAARMIAEQKGLELNVERQYYSPTVAVGKILSQLPPAGSQVRRGWQVRVAESLGPQRIAIPNVIGQTERAANINIRRRGLNVGAIAQIQSPDAHSQVMAQATPQNASGVSAPKISLLVATSSQPQAFVMPSFVGQQLGSTIQAVQNSGMKVGSVTSAPPPESSPGTPVSPPFPGSTIVMQNPAAGEKVFTGATVNFEVR